MLLSINNISINLIFDSEELLTKIPVLFLHGFTGSGEDWEFVSGKLTNKFSPIYIDLIGHGKSSSPEDSKAYSSESQIIIIDKILEYLSLKNVVLVGYSMGGRLALTYAVENPEKVIALILESTSFGIENEFDRFERLKSDENLAESIMQDGIEKFIERWLNIPLFDSLKNLSAAQFEQIKLKKVESNNIIGLTNSLSVFSTGKMNDYFLKASNLNNPVLLISGELDEKFTKIGQKAVNKLPNARLKTVPNCGHNVHLENQEEFLKLINTFLSNIREKE